MIATAVQYLVGALALVWAVSAAICWEAHGKALLANDGYWLQRTLRSICPVFNTIAACRYAAYVLRRG